MGIRIFRRRAVFHAGTPAIALLAACGAGPDTSPTVVVRDSAGVRIVESQGAIWRTGEEWRVDARPLLEIGQVDGDPPYQFFHVSGVDILPDGGVVVVDGGSAQLRRYGPDGRHLWSAGGRGAGPGEFQQPVYLGQYDDGSFAVWDRQLARLTVIDTDGRTVRTESFATGESAPIASAIFPDGALLAAYPNPVPPPPPGTVLADTIGLWRVPSSGREPVLLSRVAGPRWFWTGQFMLPVPFTTAALHALAGERLVTAAGDVPGVQIYGPDGRWMARYTVMRDPLATSSAEVRGLVDHWIEQRDYGAPSTVWNEWLDRMPIPERRPAYDRLRVGASGHIWARHYLLESDPAATPRWDVFAPEGEYLGVVDTPPGLEITTILDHAVAGVFRDSLDVEYIRVHRLSTGPSDPSIASARIDSPEPNARVSMHSAGVPAGPRRGDSKSPNR